MSSINPASVHTASLTHSTSIRYLSLDHGVPGGLRPVAGTPPASLDVAAVSQAQYFCVVLGRRSVSVQLRGLPTRGGNHGHAIRPTNSYPILVSALRAFLKDCIAIGQSHRCFPPASLLLRTSSHPQPWELPSAARRDHGRREQAATRLRRPGALRLNHCMQI